MGTHSLQGTPTPPLVVNRPAPVTPPANNTTVGIFTYNAARSGWQIADAVRTAENLPRIFIINASPDVVQSIADLYESASMSGRGFTEFMHLIGVPGTSPNRIDNNEGLSIVIDVRLMTTSLGAQIDVPTFRSIPFPLPYGFQETPIDEDAPLPSTGPFTDRRFLAYADVRITMNLLMPLRAADVIPYLTNANPQVFLGNNGQEYTNIFDLKDEFFRDALGIVSRKAYLTINFDHEVKHAGTTENPGGMFAFNFGGHQNILAGVLNDPARWVGGRPTLVTNDVLADPVEKGAYEDAFMRGDLTGGGSRYLEQRRGGYQQKLNRALAQLELAHPGSTASLQAFRLAVERGWFRDAEARVGSVSTIVEPNEQDPVKPSFSLTTIVDGVVSAVTIIDGAQIGIALGSVLGNYVTKNPIGQIAASAALKTILGGLGEALDNGAHSTAILADGIPGMIDNFGDNLVSGAIGSISSFLTAEIIDALGIDGLAGEALSSLGSSAINTVLTNIIVDGANIFKPAELFAGVGTAVVSAAGSFIGGKLADAVKTFDNVGGQIGSAVGAAYGAFAASRVIIAFGITNPVVALAIVAITVFIDKLIFGFIGSLFGGTPRSDADLLWDATEGKFAAGVGYTRKGGNRNAAESLATSAANNLNSVLEASGSTLIDASTIQTGNYGMRGKNYTYRPISSHHKSTITASFPGSDKKSASNLVNHGTYLALSGMVNQLAGGDVYVKRAILASLNSANGNPDSDTMGAAGSFSMETLFGDITIARDYSTYLRNYETIDGIISSAPESAFSAGWLLTFVRAAELGLNKRAVTDWVGGFSVFFDEIVDDKIDGVSYSTALIDASLDSNGGRNWVVVDDSEVLIGTVADTVVSTSQTHIEATTAADVIDLREGYLSNQVGYTVDGHLNNDIAMAGADFTASSTPWDLNFSASSLRVTKQVIIASDSVTESDETFVVSIAGSPGMNAVGRDGIVTIKSANSAPVLMVGKSFAGEGDGYAIFRISMSKAASSSISFDLSIEGLTAQSGPDFSAGLEVSADGISGWVPATSLTLTAGTTSYYVRTAIVADNGLDSSGQTTNVERNETFELVATVTAGAGSIGNGTVQISGKGTILDATISGDPYVWVDDLIVHEGAGTAPVTVNRSRTNGGAATVQLSAKDRVKLDIPVAATVDGGAGNDTIHASDLGDNLLGSAGNDILNGGRLDDWLLGGDGDDTLNAGSATANTLGGDGNYLDGGAGNDIIIGREGSDWLEGGDGVDKLEGGLGGDVLAGGAGKGDSLRGGLGDDQYIFRTGDADGSTSAADADVVLDESGMTVAKLYNAANPTATVTETQFKQSFYQAVFGKTGLKDWSGTKVASIATNTSSVGGEEVMAGGDDTLVFGTGISIDDIRITAVEVGGAKTDLLVEITLTGEKILLKDWFNPLNKIENFQFADGQVLRVADFDTFILGTDGEDFIYGTMGNDFVHAGGGNDIVYLLFGNDFGNGGEGNDFVSGDPGNDIVVGMNGDDLLLGGQGYDTVSGGAGRDEVRGDGGRDILSGGTGDDTMVGGSGDDVFRFNRGDGQDVLIDELSDEWEVVWISGVGYQNGYTAGSGADLGAIFQNGAKVYDATNTLSRMRYDMETGRLYRHKPLDPALIAANSGTDTIEFDFGIDVNDIQFRVVGSDIVVGVEPSGAVNASFASLTDKLVLKEWATSTAARGSIEQFAFFSTGTINIANLDLFGGTDGDDWDAAKITGTNAKGNWITGGAGKDEVVGGTINDLLSGNGGADWLKGGLGADVLLGGAGDDLLDGGAGGQFHSGDGIATDSLGNAVAGSTSVAAGDTLVGGDGFDVASYGSAAGAVTASLLNAAVNTGDAQYDSYSSVEGLIGSAFNDTLAGDYDGNELTGGVGNDDLRGNLGDDVYVFGKGDGADTITDEYASSTETIASATGALSPPWVERIEMLGRTGTLYNFQHIVENSETGEIAYKKAFTNASDTPALPGRTADGWQLDENGVAQFVVNGAQVTRTAPAGNAGDDTLYFDDVTKRIGSTLTGNRTIGLSNLNFAFTGADLVITIAGTTDSVTLKNFRTAGTDDFKVDHGIENLQFVDGSYASLKGLVFNADGSLGTTGGANDDLIVDMVAAGNTTLTGAAGDDVLSGRDGNDTLDGGDGDDLMTGGAGNDAFVGGAGVDTVTYFGSAQQATVNLSSGSVNGDAIGDTFSGIENLVGSEYNDAFTADAADNVLVGNGGADLLYGGAGNDVMDGGAGNDSAQGGLGDDRADGGDDVDTMYGNQDNDVLIGGAGDDVLMGDHGTTEDSLAGIVSTINRLTNAGFEDLGVAANDVAVSGGTTTTDLPGWYAAPGTAIKVAGAAGSRRLALDGGSSNLTIAQSITGLGANQVFSLNFHANNAAGASGQFEVWWNDARVAIITPTTTGGTYTYSVTGSASGNNVLKFVGLGTADGAGSTIDSVNLFMVGGGRDALSGGAGNDTLYGGDNGDVVSGDEGDDILRGGTGDDALSGGLGNDQLFGGAGNDSYFLSGDGGIDTITTGGGHDNIVFGATVDGGSTALAAGALWFGRSGADLVITVQGTATSVTVKDWFTSTTATTASDNAARRIVAGDKAITRTDVEALFLEMQRIGSGAPDAAYQAVFDAVWQPVASFTDRFVLTGDANANTLTPDPLMIGGGRYLGLDGNDTLNGTALGDALVGGAGNDTIVGGAGDDVVEYGTEAGFDTVNGGDGYDKLVATTDNAIIGLAAISNVEKIDGNGKANAQIQIAAGTTLDLTAIETVGIAKIVGSTGTETITGTANADVIDGGAGNDVAHGAGGDDRLLGGSGVDLLDGGDGIDTADFSSLTTAVTIDLSLSSDQVTGGTDLVSIENARGGTGNDTLTGSAGANRLEGADGNDALAGGDGDDVLQGGAGVDSYNGGNGFDIVDFSDKTTGISVHMTTSGTIDGGTETFANIEGFIGGSGADVLMGRHGGAWLSGGDGNDSLYAASGDDTLIGGAGNDYFVGGAGNDTVVYSGNRADYTIDTALKRVTDINTANGNEGADNWNTEIEYLQFADVTISLGLGGNNPPLVGAGLGNQTGYDNQAFSYTIPANAFYDLDLGDGLIFTATLLDGSALPSWLTFSGTGFSYGANNATVLGLVGQSFTVRVTAVDGSGSGAGSVSSDFTLTIASGVGTAINGTAGADTLTGTARGETITGGDGNDTITPLGGTDIANGGNGVDRVSYAASAAGVGVDLTAGTGTGGDAAGDQYLNVEQVTGSAYTDQLRGSASDNALEGGAGDDYVEGLAGNDTLTGQAGIDTLLGGDGNDQIYATRTAAGAVEDVVDGGNGIDTLWLNQDANNADVNLATATNITSIENLRGSTLNDKLTGNEFANHIWGDAGNDELKGGFGGDTLSGDAGNDVLEGGGGTDILNGGTEDDKFILTAVGEDTVDGGAGNDTASFEDVTTALNIDLANAAHKLTGIENVIGGDGDDIIAGNSAANQIVGGDGIDTVSYAGSTSGTAVNSAAVGAVTVASTTVAAARVIALNGVRADLSANTSTSATTLVGATAAAGAGAAGDWYHGIENLTGSTYQDQLRGNLGDNVVKGGGGDDLIYGGSGNDTLYGDAANDVIYGEGGEDSLYGGDGDDRLFGDGQSDRLWGGNGNDILDAGDEGDVLEGQAGNDTMVGGNGGDVYIFSRGDGQDTIYNYDADPMTDPLLRDAISITFDPSNPSVSIAYSELWFTKSGKDLLVRVMGTTDQITVKDWFTNTTANDWTAAEGFYVDTIIDGTRKTTKVDLPALLAIMAGQSPPASFSALPTATQTSINLAWAYNDPPTINDPADVIAAENTTGQSQTVVLTFDVFDNETLPLVTLVASASGSVFQPIQASDIGGTGTTRTLTLRTNGNANGTSTITIQSYDGVNYSTAVTVNVSVLAAADSPIGTPAVVIGNTGSTINLPAGMIALADTDGSEAFQYIKIEGIPVGAVLSDGTNSFTATAGSTMATITTWNLATLRITPPVGSSADMNLTLKAQSKETGAIAEIATGKQFSAETSVAITVTVNATPTGVMLTSVPGGVNENVAGVIVGTLGAVDADGSGTYTYKIVGGADAAKFIDPNDVAGANQLQLASGQSLNYEAPAQIIVRVTDKSNPASPVTYQQTLTITPNNVVEPIALSFTQPGAVAEASSASWAGVTLTGTDPEGGTITYEIDPTRGPASAFQIVGGAVKLVAGLDYENRPSGFGTPVGDISSTTVYVRAKVGSRVGTWMPLTFQLQNSAPSQPNAFTTTVSEWATGDTPNLVVATLGGSTDPNGGAITYDFAAGGNYNGWFQIVGNQLRLNTPTFPNGFDYEWLVANGGASFNVGIVAKDSSGKISTARTSAITVTNKNEAPVSLGVFHIFGGEDDFHPASPPLDTSAILANFSDPEGNPLHFVSVTTATSKSGSAGLIVAGDGSVGMFYRSPTQFQSLAAGVTDTDTITFVVADAAGLTTTGTIQVHITGVNDAPTISGLTWKTGFEGGIITENLAPNTPLATVNVSDLDAAPGALSITVNDSALKVVWTGAEYQLQINNGYNYEAIGSSALGGADISRNLTITASDGISSANANATAYVRDLEPLIYNGASASWTDVGYDPDGNQLSISTNGFASGYAMVSITNLSNWPNVYVITGVAYDHDGGGFSNGYQLLAITSATEPAILPGAEDYYFTFNGNQPTQIKRELPIVLDLDGDGLDLVSLSASSVYFDQGADGTLNRTGWVGASDGLLVFDRNRNGLIENATEISFVQDKAGATTDLEGLAGLDTNNDGTLDARDSRFAELQVWQDLNQDGVSQANELRYLADAGIKSIDLARQATGQTNAPGPDNAVFNTTHFTRTDGSQGLVGDVGLAYEAGSITPPATQTPATGNGTTTRPTRMGLFAQGVMGLRGRSGRDTERRTLFTTLANRLGLQSLAAGIPYQPANASEASVAGRHWEAHAIDREVIEPNEATPAAATSLAAQAVDGGAEAVPGNQPDSAASDAAPASQLPDLDNWALSEAALRGLRNVATARFLPDGSFETILLDEAQPAETPAPASIDRVDLQPELMAQFMATFGARTGEGARPQRDQVQSQAFDYFASGL